MKRHAHRLGFTIVETMIVLAVTGGLFVVIASTMAGRQRTNEFNSAIQEARANITTVISQVSAGYFPNSSNFSCTANGTSDIKITSGSTVQGENSDCVFLGKVLQFGVSGTDPEQVTVYTVAARRLADDTAPAPPDTPFSTTGPQAIYETTSGGVIANATDSFKLDYGLTTVWAKDAGGSPIGGVGFLMQPNSLHQSSGVYNSGAQPIDLVPIKGSALGGAQDVFVTKVNNYVKDVKVSTGDINPSNPIQICLASGGTNQSGLIIIGGNGKQLSVNLQIKSNKTCS